MARSLLPEKCGRPRRIGTPACPRQRTFRQLLRLEHGALDGAAGVDEAFALAGVLALAGVVGGLARALALAGVDAGARDLGGCGRRESGDGERGGSSGNECLGVHLLLPVIGPVRSLPVQAVEVCTAPWNHTMCEWPG